MDPHPAAGPERRYAAWLYAVAGAAYLVDRVTKVVVEETLAGGDPAILIPGVLQLRFTENPGGAFSLFGSVPWLFFGATMIVSVVIVAASRTVHERISAIGLGLVLGGALGNLTDRILRGPGFSGKVIDFVDFMVWPVFNAADSAIVIGAGMILFSGARHRDEHEPAPG